MLLARNKQNVSVMHTSCSNVIKKARCNYSIPSGAAAVKAGGGSPLRGGAGAGQQPVQVVIKDSPIILAQVSVH